MEEWGDKNVLAHTNFRVALEGVRLDRILGDKEELQRLRHDYTALKEECKLLKFVLAHRKLDLQQEVIDRTTPTVRLAIRWTPRGTIQASAAWRAAVPNPSTPWRHSAPNASPGSRTCKVVTNPWEPN